MTERQTSSVKPSGPTGRSTRTPAGRSTRTSAGKSAAKSAGGPAGAPADRPLRADARRNRRRVLDAARDVFLEHGTEAQMEDIARRAGVGVGTIYRHFPTKQALVNELTEQWMAEGAVNAADALALPDAWEALTVFVRQSTEIMVRDRGLREVYGDIGKLLDNGAGTEHQQLRANVTKLLDRAHEAGVLRADVGYPQFQALMCGLAMATTRAAPGEHHVYADVVLNGLKT
ncbi:helix-turn-helix domain-containing protein [Actinomadura fulvescens]|uniref:HTH tetR-type domain-containing protein n=1 Tax=Actinomadura fulvescens TaxID=46160 RepID=A0ABP6CAA7_9ACTN